jgi:hypothetical protein
MTHPTQERDALFPNQCLPVLDPYIPQKSRGRGLVAPGTAGAGSGDSASIPLSLRLKNLCEGSHGPCPSVNCWSFEYSSTKKLVWIFLGVKRAKRVSSCSTGIAPAAEAAVITGRRLNIRFFLWLVDGELIGCWIQRVRPRTLGSG